MATNSGSSPQRWSKKDVVLEIDDENTMDGMRTEWGLMDWKNSQDILKSREEKAANKLPRELV